VKLRYIFGINKKEDLNKRKILSKFVVSQSSVAHPHGAAIVRRSIVESSSHFTSRHVVAIVVEAINFRVDVIIARIFVDGDLAACLEITVGGSDGVAVTLIITMKIQ
jgi:hypothetical protein